jgi:hypothetical protein
MKRKLAIIFTGALVFAAASGTAHAAFNYQLLESFPGFFIAGASPDLPTMILAIYKFGIWTVGIAGLFMLVIGGFTYMTSAGNTATAGSAKKIIWDSLLGIVAALGAYLIMYVINPDLTKIDFSRLAPTDITEGAETSSEASGTLSNGVAGSCGGLSTQAGINNQCSSASSELSGMLSCIAGKVPNAVITSITDSKGYANCIPSNWTSSCAHSKYSCHYGGKKCSNSGKSYAVDLSTRNSVTVSQLAAAAGACGASSVKDESSNYHVHASVGKAAGCECN